MSAKPLKWRKPTDHPDDPDGLWIADGLVGKYIITEERSGFLLWWAHNNFVWEKHPTVTDAMQSAEKDWQKRFADRQTP